MLDEKQGAQMTCARAGYDAYTRKVSATRLQKQKARLLHAWHTATRTSGDVIAPWIT
jgi:hypothetical protein